MTGNIQTDNLDVPEDVIWFVNNSLKRYARALRRRARMGLRQRSARWGVKDRAQPVPAHIARNYATARHLMQELGINV